MELITEFFVVRHGQTVSNGKKCVQGQTNTHLDALGQRQVQAVAERLKDEKFDCIYSSDLVRAMETSSAIRQYHMDAPFVSSQKFREWNFGDLEGRSILELKQTDPELINNIVRDVPDILIPGGESKVEFYQRVSSAFDELAENHAGQRILVVSHGGVLQALFHKLVGFVPVENLLCQSANTSLSVCRRSAAGWQLTTWNDYSHLKNIGKADLF